MAFSVLPHGSCLQLHFTHPEKINSMLVLLSSPFFASAPLPAGLAVTLSNHQPPMSEHPKPLPVTEVSAVQSWALAPGAMKGRSASP